MILFLIVLADGHCRRLGGRILPAVPRRALHTVPRPAAGEALAPLWPDPEDPLAANVSDAMPVPASRAMPDLVGLLSLPGLSSTQTRTLTLPLSMSTRRRSAGQNLPCRRPMFDDRPRVKVGLELNLGPGRKHANYVQISRHCRSAAAFCARRRSRVG